MANNHPASLRFDHREITVIFSLFIFVSLLMFTVGIIVGKGLSAAKYEQLVMTFKERPPETPAHPEAVHAESVTVPEPETHALVDEKDPEPAEPAHHEPLHLVPKAVEHTPLEPSPEALALAKNPKIAPLLEGGAPPVRKPAAIANPSSFANGPFTVQVGSYPTKADAMDRVSHLKKLGFPHSYVSLKKFGDGKEIWYRVWLGYYPDQDGAKKSGEFLQKKGEVTNYLIRKSDNPG